MSALDVKREPGVVTVGDWAHVRYHKRQHLVAAVEPETDAAEPVRFACGHRTWQDAVWHDAPKPHLPRCKGCAVANRRPSPIESKIGAMAEEPEPERIEGPTPGGGAYSEAVYLDARGRTVDRDKATRVIVTEYDANGDWLAETVATVEATS